VTGCWAIAGAAAADDGLPSGPQLSPSATADRRSALYSTGFRGPIQTPISCLLLGLLGDSLGGFSLGSAF